MCVCVLTVNMRRCSRSTVGAASTVKARGRQQQKRKKDEGEKVFFNFFIKINW